MIAVSSIKPASDPLRQPITTSRRCPPSSDAAPHRADPTRIVLTMRHALILVAAVALASCSGSSTAPSAPSPPPVVTPTPTPSPTPAPVVRGPNFSQAFWNQFVHNSFDAPGSLSALQRLTAAPTLYLKTVDEAGQPIDAFTLQTVEDAMRVVAPTWGGGRFGLASVERGTGSKEGVSGYLTVKWPNPSAGAFCGLAQVGIDGGWIALNYLRTDVSCRCNNGARMPPRIIKHELGHAFGYYHTDDDGDLMRNGVSGCADAQPSAREAYHATIAYQTPVGTTGFRAGAGPIIID